MSQKANPTLIGAFVVGALFIAIGAVLILTGGELLKKQAEFVMHFQGSVKGLSVGAPVKFRGVEIGTVKNIEILLTPDQSTVIPVTVDINPTAFTRRGFESAKSLDEFIQDVLEECEKEGLRAQLQMQSLLTGQLFIQVDYFPNTTAHFTESALLPEIPTVPSTLEELGSMFQDFPINRVLADVQKAMAGLADLTTSKELRDTNDSVKQAFDDMSQLMRNLDTRTEPLNRAIDDLSQLISKLDNRTVPLESTIVEAQRTMIQASSTLKAAEQTFNEATKTLMPIRGLVDDDSELLDLLEEALISLTDAANAAAALADTLERRPEAIIRGKGVLGGD